jgi:hypothetical protein
MPRDPQTVAQDWANGLAAKTGKMADSVRGVTVAPGQLAARQQQVWLQNVQASAPRWAAAVGAVSLQSWQDSMINVGIPRVASGASAAVPKMAAAMAQLLPHIESVKRSLPPRGTFEQNVARATAMMKGMHDFKMRGTP